MVSPKQKNNRMKTTGIKHLIIGALCSTWSLAAFGQKQYTLDECREMALRNNVAVRNAANEVEAARQGEKEAFTRYFPTVSATGMGYNADKGLLQMEMGPGMSASLLKNGIMGGVTVTQPLFAGGQIVNGNRLAAVGAEVSRVRKEQSEDEVELTVEQYYWQVVVLQEKLSTLRTVERRLESLQRDVETAVSAGVTNRNDLLQVQLRHNDLTSRRINLENNLVVCRMMLAQYVGLKDDTLAVENPIAPEEVPAFPEELYRDPLRALPLTTGYRLLRSDVQASRLQHRMEVGKHLPTVAVGAGYLYDNLTDHSHPFALGFVSVSVPLSGWWGGSHAIRRQKLQIRSAENRLTDSSERLVIGMRKAWADLQDAYKQMLIAHRSIGQSTENLRLNEDYYRAGTVSMSDLLEAQSLFRQSRDQYAEAYAQFRVKRVEYLQATGR